MLGAFSAKEAIWRQEGHPHPYPALYSSLTPPEQQLAAQLGGQCLVVMHGFWEYEVCWAREVR